MLELYAGSAAYPQPSPQPVLSIGNFDGVHRGHQHLLRALLHQAERRGAPSCVYTFEPPPRVILAPQQHRCRILAWPDKLRLLGDFGVRQVVVERFTRAFAQHPPEWFAAQVLGRRLRPQAIVVGYDFRFGRARAGDLGLLRRLLPGVVIEQVEPCTLGDEVVSSSRIRELIQEGEVGRAALLLGRPHAIRGTVVAGDRRGRTLGFPTANLEVDSELLPADGVYAVRAAIDGETQADGVANLGFRPTFDGRQHRVEVHLLDGTHELYGREMVVSFVDRVRPERRFADADALMAQIRADVAAARERLGAGA